MLSTLCLPLHFFFFSVLLLSGFHLNIESYVSNDCYLQCNCLHFPKANLMLFPYNADVFRVYVVLYYFSVLAKFAVLSLVVLDKGLTPSSRALRKCSASDSKEIATPHWTIWPAIYAVWLPACAHGHRDFWSNVNMRGLWFVLLIFREGFLYLSLQRLQAPIQRALVFFPLLLFHDPW